MTTLQDITTAVFRLLSARGDLTALATVYRGGKRPLHGASPSVTVQARRLAPGEGRGMWMCDVVVTCHAPLRADRTIDDDMLDRLTAIARETLEDAELDLAGVRAFPLIGGEVSGPEWDATHDGEAMQESTFGLLFVTFGAVA